MLWTKEAKRLGLKFGIVREFEQGAKRYHSMGNIDGLGLRFVVVKNGYKFYQRGNKIAVRKK